MAHNRELALRRRQQAAPGPGGAPAAASTLSDADRALIAEKAGRARRLREERVLEQQRKANDRET